MLYIQSHDMGVINPFPCKGLLGLKGSVGGKVRLGAMPSFSIVAAVHVPSCLPLKCMQQCSAVQRREAFTFKTAHLQLDWVRSRIAATGATKATGGLAWLSRATGCLGGAAGREASTALGARLGGALVGGVNGFEPLRSF